MLNKYFPRVLSEIIIDYNGETAYENPTIKFFQRETLKHAFKWLRYDIADKSESCPGEFEEVIAEIDSVLNSGSQKL